MALEMPGATQIILHGSIKGLSLNAENAVAEVNSYTVTRWWSMGNGDYF